MLTHPAHARHTLIEVADLHQDPLPPPVRAHVRPLRAVLDWARDYLCRPHPELGRTGNVCPYAQGSLDRNAFYLTVAPGRAHPADELDRLLIHHRDWLLDLSRHRGDAAQFTTILIVFPDLAAADVPEVVDLTQERLKARFVVHGLMLGEFHAGPPAKGGLWNPDFAALRCPVPLLAIRHMVPTDFFFLRDDPDNVRAYLARFADQIPPHLRETVRRAVDQLGLAPAPVGGAGAH
ncbi:hypothetical protein CA850_27810 [Micromonospora echinospora]|uniref:DUF6875 domain-containing protein n=1 Tax=Micromonospora echinospora TaxID=1877 RepID=A0A1C4ZGL0_MICEC|nr:hypothetical protein [Micromonospora echinospora]OZV75873.1 hypothetical protein CA850_27810 [Micromonospora echinospora]SCF32177.1 hypothetical protein GA0070618_5231 [Micromonospora echinospora]